MSSRRTATLASAVTLLALTGCVTLKRTPEARFFVLRAVAQPASGAAQGAGVAVGLSPVRVPGYLRRPQLVTGSGPHELQIDEFERWAEPLEEGVARVLAEDLAALLPGHRVVRYPWSASLELRCRVVVELESFAPGRDGSVRLRGRWSVLRLPDGRRLASAPAVLEAGPVAVGPDGLDAGAAVAAMSGLLARLAESIAEAVQALPAAPETTDPDSSP